jgi:hypothetical protein
MKITNCLYALLSVAVLITISPAQLTSTETETTIGCPAGTGNANNYSWVFKDPSGAEHTFNGHSSVEFESRTCVKVDGEPVKCKPCGENATTSLDTPSTDGLYYLQATGATGTAVLGALGWVNPKYQIVGVEYAPPGSKSTVIYADNSVVGYTVSDMNSFSSGVTQTVSLSSGFGLFGFTDKVTETESTSYTQEQDSSSSVAVSQTTSSSNSLAGFSDPVNGINHDYDFINVWVNSIALFGVYPTQPKTVVQLTGYGYDLNDTPAAPDMDVIGVQLGCLNGDFYQLYVSNPTTNPNWLTCEDLFNNNLSRSWALKNTDGSSPALTPTLANSSPPYDFCQQTGTDLYNICQADPFANSDYGKEEFPPPSGSDTTADGRFTACSNSGCSTTIDYEPGKCPIAYSQGYSTTVTASQGDKDTYSQSFSTESQFGDAPSGNGFSASFLATLTTTNTYTSITQFSQSTNSTNGQTASFSICGPAEGYTGPLSFTAYQDNLYGTFMFYPVID